MSRRRPCLSRPGATPRSPTSNPPSPNSGPTASPPAFPSRSWTLAASSCPRPDRAAITFKNGYTYSGHPVCCDAALKNIEIIETEGLLEHVREIAPHFQARLRDLARHAIVGDARGMGLVGCVESRPAPGMSESDRLRVDWEFGARVDARCEEMGLTVRPLINMCVFSPPLIVTVPQIDRMFDILDRAIGQVEADLM